MKGITEERLRELAMAPCDSDTETLMWLLKLESKELNTWLPIESAPKDRQILLLWPDLGVMEGEWIVDVFWCDMWELTGCSMDDQPTHWQELPLDPVTNDPRGSV